MEKYKKTASFEAVSVRGLLIFYAFLNVDGQT
jgi:hypothetical protein